MTISTRRVGALIWVLIYGGLFALGIGFALDRAGASYGGAVIGAGIVAVAAGCVLVWIRSRMTAP
ncbi:MAG TPA: hypothetical protein VGO85_02005 [Caldimonas sp.]|nr:hypothetical protein [Caldimonas sp.]